MKIYPSGDAESAEGMVSVYLEHTTGGSIEVEFSLKVEGAPNGCTSAMLEFCLFQAKPLSPLIKTAIGDGMILRSV